MKKYLIDFICLFIFSLCSITLQAQSVAPSWQWAKRPNIEITPYTNPAVSSDGNGNIYVTGGFVGTATFATLPTPTTLISAGESDIFIAKYDASGNVLWANRAGSIHVDIAYAIKYDGFGNFYLAGFFIESTNFETTSLVSSANSANIFIAKFNATTGDLLWAKQGQGADGNDRRAYDIAVDNAGDAYITGSIAGSTTTFAPLPPLNVSNRWWDIFVVKYNGSGIPQWQTAVGSTAAGYYLESGNGIAVDQSGKVFVTGRINGSTAEPTMFGSIPLVSNGGGGFYETDYFLAKYNPSTSSWEWAVNGGGTNSSPYNTDFGSKVSLDNYGNPFVNGVLNSQTSVFGSITITEPGIRGYFVAKYTSQGNLSWIRPSGGVGGSGGNSSKVDANGNFYMAGTFDGTTTVGNETLTSNGWDNSYVASWNTNGVFQWVKHIPGSYYSHATAIDIESNGKIDFLEIFAQTETFDCTTLNATSFTSLAIAKLGTSSNGPEIPTVTASSNPVCNGSSTTLSVSGGNLNGATDWKWYTGSCGGTLTGSGPSISVSPSQNTTYYVRGEGGCTGSGGCGSVSVTINNNPPSISCSGPVTINTTHGLCTGTTTLLPPTVNNCGSSGNALSFNSGYGNVPDAPILNPFNEWTLEIWVKRTNTGVQEGLIEKYNNPGSNYGYLLRVLDTDKAMAGFVFGCCGGYFITGTTTILPNVWYHLATTFNRNTGVMKLYVNGVLDAQLTGMVGLPTIPNTASLKLGARGDDVAHRLSNGGLMDEVRIWSVERTQAQIQAGMNAELGTQPGLVALYHFNQGIAGGNNTGLTTVIDGSGNNNNGTLLGFTLTGPTSNWVAGQLSGSAPVVTNNAPSTYPIGNTTVTWTATDARGNSATCTQVVTVVDNQAPVITCPSNISVTATSAAGTVVNYSTPVGTDNCSSTTSRTAGLASSATFPIGTTSVTHKVTDAAGLTAECSFTVTVTGLVPQIVCPQNITANNTPENCGAIVNFAATETTGIPASVITYSQNPGTLFPIGTTIVTATATNAVGTSVCTFTITVTDNEKPMILVQNINRCFEDDNSGCNINLGATATDNCAVQSLTNNAPTCFPVGTTTVIWYATDIHGNASTATQMVTRNPEIHIDICAGPTLRIYKGAGSVGGPYGPQSVNLNATVTGGTPGYTYSWSPVTGLNNAGIANTIASPTVTTTYTLTVTDSKECTRSLSITVEVLPLSAAICSGTGNNIKFAVCHIPPGLPSNPQNICISESALNAHLISGSVGHNNCYLGLCGQQLCFSTTAVAPSLVSATTSAGKGKTAINEEIRISEFSLKANPNPSAHSFSIRVESLDQKTPVHFKVVNIAGQIMEKRNTIITGQSLKIGDNYRPGTYLIEAVQGKQRKTITVIKLSD